MPLGNLGYVCLSIFIFFFDRPRIRNHFLKRINSRKRFSCIWNIIHRAIVGFHLFSELNKNTQRNFEINTVLQRHKYLNTRKLINVDESYSLGNFDFVIIGAGPGGLAAALELSNLKLKILIIDAGPGEEIQGKNSSLAEIMSTRWVNFGKSYLESTPNISVLQGQGIGGSTAISGMIMHPLPLNQIEKLREHLASFSVNFTVHEYQIEEKNWLERLHVRQFKNEFSTFHSHSLKFQISEMPRAVDGCLDSGLCLLGCPNKGKNSLDQELYRILMKSGCQFLFNYSASFSPKTGESLKFSARNTNTNRVVEISAKKAIILAAGPVASPRLASMINPALTGVGQNLALNLSPSALFVYPGSKLNHEKLNMGLEVFSSDGLKYASQSLPEALLKVRAWPYLNEILKQNIESKNLSVWTASIPAISKGELLIRSNRNKIGSYFLENQDKSSLRYAETSLGYIGEHLGANTVIPLKNSLGSSHIFGTLSKCGPRLHPRILCTDSSQIPWATGLNPIITILTLSTLITRNMKSELT